MSLCQQLREQLIQYVADGEPVSIAYDGLRAHLAACPICGAELDRLRLVEQALRTYPLTLPKTDVTAHVLRAIAAQQVKQEAWHPLPWDVWVPVAAFAVAIIIAMMSLPSQPTTTVALQELAASPIVWPSPIDGWIMTVQRIMAESSFWAIWIGLFAATAGLGLGLSLANWDKRNSESLDRLETEISHTASRLWDQARRAH